MNEKAETRYPEGRVQYDERTANRRLGRVVAIMLLSQIDNICFTKAEQRFNSSREVMSQATLDHALRLYRKLPEFTAGRIFGSLLYNRGMDKDGYLLPVDETEEE